MDQTNRLGIVEFLQDVHGVVMVPRRRFVMIHERGVAWGSLLLLFVPTYFTLAYLGGLYFDHEPFWGYDLLVPAVAAALAIFFKALILHVVARLWEGKGRYFAAKGRLIDQLVVVGYAGIPGLAILLVTLIVFLMFPAEMGYLLRHFRVATWCVMIGLGIACFVWNLILMVLALRNVYRMHDFKLVVSVILGAVLFGLGAIAIEHSSVRPSGIDVAYALPILNERMGLFFASDPSTGDQKPSRLDIHVDRLAFRWRQPGRFELVFVSPAQRLRGKDAEQNGAIVVGRAGMTAVSADEIALVRVVGMPGETVEIFNGQLLIDARPWDEPYITQAWRSSSSVSARKLGPTDYFVLPENRHLLESGYSDYVVDRSRIVGRMLTAKWPLGWWLLQPSVFQKGHPR